MLTFTVKGSAAAAKPPDLWTLVPNRDSATAKFRFRNEDRFRRSELRIRRAEHDLCVDSSWEYVDATTSLLDTRLKSKILGNFNQQNDKSAPQLPSCYRKKGTSGILVETGVEEHRKLFRLDSDASDEMREYEDAFMSDKKSEEDGDTEVCAFWW